MRWYMYLLSPTLLTVIIVSFIAIYFVFTAKKRKYEFVGLGDTGWEAEKFDELQAMPLSAFVRRSKTSNKKGGGGKKYKHEEKCREIFERVYQQPFPKEHPVWLKNPATKVNLELDGFCPYIKTPYGRGIAFEYDGEQHANPDHHFNRGNPYNFLYQKEKDFFKDRQCKKMGVTLIRIPHFIAYEDLERFIFMKLKEKNLLPGGVTSIPSISIPSYAEEDESEGIENINPNKPKRSRFQNRGHDENVVLGGMYD